MTTSQKITQSDFTVGEKVSWVTPTGYKETVTVTGKINDDIVVIHTCYGGMGIKLWERDGWFVGVDHWGYLSKQETPNPVPAKPSFWTRVKSYFL